MLHIVLPCASRCRHARIFASKMHNSNAKQPNSAEIAFFRFLESTTYKLMSADSAEMPKNARNFRVG
jgi:hypothetical protein